MQNQNQDNSRRSIPRRVAGAQPEQAAGGDIPLGVPPPPTQTAPVVVPTTTPPPTGGANAASGNGDVTMASVSSANGDNISDMLAALLDQMKIQQEQFNLQQREIAELKAAIGVTNPRANPPTTGPVRTPTREPQASTPVANPLMGTATGTTPRVAPVSELGPAPRPSAHGHEDQRRDTNRVGDYRGVALSSVSPWRQPYPQFNRSFLRNPLASGPRFANPDTLNQSTAPVRLPEYDSFVPSLAEEEAVIRTPAFRTEGFKNLPEENFLDFKESFLVTIDLLRYTDAQAKNQLFIAMAGAAPRVTRRMHPARFQNVFDMLEAYQNKFLPLSRSETAKTALDKATQQRSEPLREYHCRLHNLYSLAYPNRLGDAEELIRRFTDGLAEREIRSKVREYSPQDFDHALEIAEHVQGHLDKERGRTDFRQVYQQTTALPQDRKHISAMSQADGKSGKYCAYCKESGKHWKSQCPLLDKHMAAYRAAGRTGRHPLGDERQTRPDSRGRGRSPSNGAKAKHSNVRSSRPFQRSQTPGPRRAAKPRVAAMEEDDAEAAEEEPHDSEYQISEEEAAIRAFAAEHLDEVIESGGDDDDDHEQDSPDFY